jgi:hypothetical protein
VSRDTIQFAVIQSFRSRALQRCWTKGDASGVRPDWLVKVTAILTALDHARSPQDLKDIGGFHALRDIVPVSSPSLFRLIGG